MLMKKITQLLLFVLCFYSCSEEIDLIGDFKETAVATEL